MARNFKRILQIALCGMLIAAGGRTALAAPVDDVPKATAPESTAPKSNAPKSTTAPESNAPKFDSPKTEPAKSDKAPAASNDPPAGPKLVQQAEHGAVVLNA